MLRCFDTKDALEFFPRDVTIVIDCWFKSLAPGSRGSNYKNLIFENVLRIKSMGTSDEIALRWMSQNTFDDKSTLVQVMVGYVRQHVSTQHQANVDLDLCKCVQMRSSKRKFECCRVRDPTTLIRIMACHLFGTKPLTEPTLTSYQLDPLNQTPAKFGSKYTHFLSRICVWNVECKMKALQFRNLCVANYSVMGKSGAHNHI